MSRVSFFDVYRLISGPDLDQIFCFRTFPLRENRPEDSWAAGMFPLSSPLENFIQTKHKTLKNKKTFK